MSTEIGAMGKAYQELKKLLGCSPDRVGVKENDPKENSLDAPLKRQVVGELKSWTENTPSGWQVVRFCRLSIDSGPIVRLSRDNPNAIGIPQIGELLIFTEGGASRKLEVQSVTTPDDYDAQGFQEIARLFRRKGFLAEILLRSAGSPKMRFHDGETTAVVRIDIIKDSLPELDSRSHWAIGP